MAIDGPAASGKSTVAQIIAKRLNCLYVDSGAMYRALTLKALNQKIDLTDKKSLVQLAQNTNISLKDNEGAFLRVYLDDEDVTKKIRDPQVTNSVA
ncbi:MAG TPA: cytidylate kinase, partial [Candidatus Omnitrophica bacterium]|nr:cytidylate kinase [Candidatus Omnitrophota bacterium]